MLSSNGGDKDVSLGIARIAHEFGMLERRANYVNRALDAPGYRVHCRHAGTVGERGSVPPEGANQLSARRSRASCD